MASDMLLQRWKSMAVDSCQVRLGYSNICHWKLLILLSVHGRLLPWIVMLRQITFHGISELFPLMAVRKRDCSIVSRRFVCCVLLDCVYEQNAFVIPKYCSHLFAGGPHNLEHFDRGEAGRLQCRRFLSLGYGEEPIPPFASVR
jgi:hypothetical protein